MALTEDLLAWATSRPWWQQQALAATRCRRLSRTSDYKGIATALLADPPVTPEGGWLGRTLEDPFRSSAGYPAGGWEGLRHVEAECGRGWRPGRGRRGTGRKRSSPTGWGGFGSGRSCCRG